ncbi:aminoglycoside phosphotransferase family protein [Kitasatospora sp. GP82]|uniref:aminoglycoside phosphotransferase family protein n=1 Tax=Kitasatospora sp. GP82 TaxID=3035089 RepID=UPI0024738159|nr:aminoglycoside phosphotransferase family protein [Kitasatospora sp. GP82]MDH6128853.1 Ser/Thr protein kinase RdoA (MazF antagonist) [Kitasatospora sp. GP82]
MAEILDEVVPLQGGRITSGVVRVGETVRRPASAASPFVASLLGLLESRGFTGAPRYLGRDQSGRDTFSYVPGWVPAKFRPWTDAQVAAAGVLARAMHEATRGSDLAGQHRVVCHHDLGPNNAVFQDEMPIAFIDFDMAAPGSPLEDVGYMAWLWCSSSKEGAPPADVQASQVRVLADAYGLVGPERAVLVDSMLERQARNVRFWAEVQAGFQAVEATAQQISDRITWSRREHEHTAAHRKVFEDALK